MFFLGSFIGLIPGIGGSCIDWISYSHAKTSVKNNEDFGKGDIRGVIGPESSSNSKEGGALIPTLLFAIPGSGGTAVLMGGLILLGVEPGIQLINNRLDLFTQYLVTCYCKYFWSFNLCLFSKTNFIFNHY